jgi:hypothetical protein
MSKPKSKKDAPKSPKNAKNANPGKNTKLDNLVQDIIYDLNNLLRNFMEEKDINESMTGKDRMRLIGAGVRNYGFIEKSYDIARENPQFMPPFFSIQEMAANLHDLDDVRQLVLILEKFLAVANTVLLVRGDRCFREGLRVYGSLRELRRGNVPGAEELFGALLSYFRRRRRPGEEEPTIKELEKDFHSLIKGTSDGKIEIINEKPQVTKGFRKVVDEVSKGKAVVKETVDAEIEGVSPLTQPKK